MLKMKVKLTYFKAGGKYYSEGSFETSCGMPMFTIYGTVRDMLDSHRLPGLMEGHSDFMVLVDVPDHDHNVPALLLPKTWRAALVALTETEAGL